MMCTYLPDDYIGVVWLWFGNSNSLPKGWLLCDGSAIDSEYSILIDRVGNNVPDMGGRVVIGAGVPSSPTNSDGSNPNWNGSPEFYNNTLLGEFNHTLTLDEIAPHQHNITMSDDWQGGPGDTKTLMTEGDGNWQTDVQGGGNWHNNVQPSIVLTYMIYAGTDTGSGGENSHA